MTGSASSIKSLASTNTLVVGLSDSGRQQAGRRDVRCLPRPVKTDRIGFYRVIERLCSSWQAIRLESIPPLRKAPKGHIAHQVRVHGFQQDLI